MMTTSTIEGVDFDVDNELETKRYGIQAGVDYGFGSGRVGLTGGYGWAKADGDSDADLKAKGWNIGLYGQFGGMLGFHGEFLAKHDRYNGEFDDGAFDGEKFDIRPTGIDGSLGYRFGIGGDANRSTSMPASATSRPRSTTSTPLASTMTSRNGPRPAAGLGLRAMFGGGLAPYIYADGLSTSSMATAISSCSMAATPSTSTPRAKAPGRGSKPASAAMTVPGRSSPPGAISATSMAFGLRAGWRFGGGLPKRLRRLRRLRLRRRRLLRRRRPARTDR